MQDNLTVSLDRKKIFIFALFCLILTTLFLSVIIVSLNDVLNTNYVPTGKSNQNHSLANLVVLSILSPIIFILDFFIISIFIRAIIKKEVIIINHRGILYNKLHIFSKPVFIHWNYIQDIRIVDSVNGGGLLAKFLCKIVNNRSIVLKLKEEFYTDLSPTKKIMYKINNKISKGFTFPISLKFTDGDVNEIFDKILTKSSSYMKEHKKQSKKLKKIKDRFIGYFNIRMVTLHSLGLLFPTLFFTTVCIYCFTLPSSKMPTVSLPILGQTNNRFIIECIMAIISISFAIYSMYLWSILIKLIFVNKDKKFLVIDKYGICWYNSNIFSKPMLIEWKHIKNICIFNPKKHLFTNNYKHAITLNITQEFYNNSSFFKRIIYKLNRKFSNGFDIRINLNFTNCNANDILDEINKYYF